MVKLLKKEMKLWQSLLLVLFVSASIIYYFKLREINLNGNDDIAKSDAQIKFVRDKNYKYTKPLLAVDLENPSSNLENVNKKLQTIIDNQQSEGLLTNASLYLRSLETGEWTAINQDDRFHPGSLIKVPMLMYYLKEAETDPSILSKKIAFVSKNKIPNQTFNTKQIEPNKLYTIKEMLKYMVCYSDNYATTALNENCDVPKFQALFEKLGLAKPNVYDVNYSLSVKEYSVFMRALYNATFLNNENSEYALQLLTESTFNEGIAANVPADVPVARKFGETFQANSVQRELHECGIVFCNRKPFLVVVMTRGTNSERQASVISKLSDTIFKSFCS